jgi:hypothetical protein
MLRDKLPLLVPLLLGGEGERSQKAVDLDKHGKAAQGIPLPRLVERGLHQLPMVQRVRGADLS